jgi:hypothetical protein
MQQVTSKRRGPNQGVIETVDDCGGVFAAIPGKGLTPAWMMGPEGGKREPMFQCPQSAIPGHVWELLALWWSCRNMRTLPKSGAFVDQPMLVRQSFPIFEMLANSQERAQGYQSSAAVTAQTVAAMFGGGR